MKILPVGADMIHGEDRQTERQTDRRTERQTEGQNGISKLRAAFKNSTIVSEEC
jgi:hypothetical protein